MDYELVKYNAVRSNSIRRVSYMMGVYIISLSPEYKTFDTLVEDKLTADLIVNEILDLVSETHPIITAPVSGMVDDSTVVLIDRLDPNYLAKRAEVDASDECTAMIWDSTVGTQSPFDKFNRRFKHYRVKDYTPAVSVNCNVFTCGDPSDVDPHRFSIGIHANGNVDVFLKGGIHISSIDTTVKCSE